MKMELLRSRGMLALIAILLAVNAVVMIARPGVAQPDHMIPRVTAGGIIALEGPMIATTNEQGDALYIWRPGRMVNGEYESVSVRRYTAY